MVPDAVTVELDLLVKTELVEIPESQPSLSVQLISDKLVVGMVQSAQQPELAVILESLRQCVFSIWDLNVLGMVLLV